MSCFDTEQMQHRGKDNNGCETIVIDDFRCTGRRRFLENNAAEEQQQHHSTAVREAVRLTNLFTSTQLNKSELRSNRFFEFQQLLNKNAQKTREKKENRFATPSKGKQEHKHKINCPILKNLLTTKA